MLTAGIDIGTTSVKGVVVDDDGHVLDRVRVPHPVHMPAADRFEHDARQAWAEGPRQAMRDLAHSRPSAVAVASMVPSLCAVDADGRPVTPGLLYGDGRGRGDRRSQSSDAGELVGFLRWLVSEAPDAPGYWSAPAVANRALGGPATIDFGTAFTSTPLFDGAGWDAAVCADAGARVDQLPSVEMMGTALGEIGPGLTLSTGGVDGMCEQLVAGAGGEGDVHVICGTTLINWIAMASPPEDAGGLWVIPHLTSGMSAVGGPSNAGGLFLGAVARLLGEHGDGKTVDPARVPVWTPYIRGERAPVHDPDRRAGLHGLDLTHGPDALMRGAWEASGFVVRHHIELSGVTPTRIVATGGGTHVEGWIQALADCTGLAVYVSAVPESAALGAAYLARMSVGAEEGFDAAAGWARTARIVDPRPEWVEPCAERYATFLEHTATG